MSTKHSAGHMQIQHIQDTCWSRSLKDWLSNKLVVLPALWGRGKNACGDSPSMHSLNWSGAGWYGSIKYDNMHLLQYLCTLQYTSLPIPLCSPGTWPRTHLSVTVTWSGWQTTCAPTPSRPAVPAAPALAALQTNALDRSRARNSVALVGQWLSLAVSERLPLVSLSLELSTSQTGFDGVFFPHGSHCSILTFSLSLCWEWLLSLHCSLYLISHWMSDHSWQKVLFGLSFAAPVLLLLNQYLPRWTWGQGERDRSLSLHFPTILPHCESGFTLRPQWAEITSRDWYKG